MISIVICSVKPSYYAQISVSIAQTIGVKYELIKVDNSANTYSIFEAYNLGVQQAKYSIICFTHEDIVFHTPNWGVNVINHFKNASIGMIGICGGDAIPVVPAPWWNSKTQNNFLYNNINSWKDKPSEHQYSNPFNEKFTDAVLLDGAWFCIPKALFNTIKFDEENFKGFHCYDSDISLQVLMHKRVGVVYDVLLEHFSAGTINMDWIQSVDVLATKWSKQLPIITHVKNKVEINLYNYECLLTYCYWCKDQQMSDREIKQVITKYLPKIHPSTLWYKDAMLLYIWKLVGYNVARFLHKPFKLFLTK